MATSALSSPLDRSYLVRFLRAFYRRRLTARGRFVLWASLALGFVGIDTRRGLVFMLFSLSAPPLLLSLLFPGSAGRVYDLAKSKLQVPVPSTATADYFILRPYELNAYIAGYTGFLRLQELAGKTSVDSQLRTAVTNELNRLYQQRLGIFSKDTPWIENYYHRRSLNITRNFIFLVPELGDYLNRNVLSRMNEAISEYDYIAPYWFVSRYESMMNEGVMSPLYNYPALFQAKAFILKQPQSELSKYLAPAFDAQNTGTR